MFSVLIFFQFRWRTNNLIICLYLAEAAEDYDDEDGQGNTPQGEEEGGDSGGYYEEEEAEAEASEPQQAPDSGLPMPDFTADDDLQGSSMAFEEAAKPEIKVEEEVEEEEQHARSTEGHFSAWCTHWWVHWHSPWFFMETRPVKAVLFFIEEVKVEVKAEDEPEPAESRPEEAPTEQQPEPEQVKVEGDRGGSYSRKRHYDESRGYSYYEHREDKRWAHPQLPFSLSWLTQTGLR